MIDVFTAVRTSALITYVVETRSFKKIKYGPGKSQIKFLYTYIFILAIIILNDSRQLTPWSKALLEKQVVAQMGKYWNPNDNYRVHKSRQSPCFEPDESSADPTTLWF
jgi:hypothetical protein